MRLAAALLTEEGESCIRVKFTLEDKRQISCTVTSINTDQGQLLVYGCYADDAGVLQGFYNADLTGSNKIFTFR
jgi:hypothetical protein